MQYGFAERFNGRLCDARHNEHLVTSYRHARQIIEDGRNDHSLNPPHTSLSGVTPHETATVWRSLDQRLSGADTLFQNTPRNGIKMRLLVGKLTIQRAFGDDVPTGSPPSSRTSSTVTSINRCVTQTYGTSRT
ncbi:MAG: transposase [Rhizobium sp.]|nr:transposase [Rhizobium sp.]